MGKADARFNEWEDAIIEVKIEDYQQITLNDASMNEVQNRLSLGEKLRQRVISNLLKKGYSKEEIYEDEKRFLENSDCTPYDHLINKLSRMASRLITK